MLRAYNYSVDPYRVVIVVVFNCHLRFAVGPEVFHLAAFTAYGRKLLEQDMCQLTAERHIVIHFAAGVTKHHSLVARSLFLGILAQVLLLVNRGSLTGTKGTMTPELINQAGHTELIGKAMFTDFLLPFEITSVLLLSAIVGAVVLSKKKL